MDAAILTVGDEVLAGDTTNTNASWLASQLTDRGVQVARILTVPDEHSVIADAVEDYSRRYDAVLVTGGLGNTPDDITMAAVAEALGREYVVVDSVKERLREKARRFRENNPELAEKYEFDMDIDDAARLPDTARPLMTEVAWAAGCAIDNVYVFPGIPEEMKAAFNLVESEFSGGTVSRIVHTPTPEGAMNDVLAEARNRFSPRIGSYPAPPGTPNRLKITGSDPEAVEEATRWLSARIETVER